MTDLTTHGCGKSWHQRGNRTGHCGRCHTTFEGLALFDAHFIRVENGVECRDPGSMLYNKKPLIFDGTYGDGSWSRTDLTDIAFGASKKPNRVDVAEPVQQDVDGQISDVAGAVLS